MFLQLTFLIHLIHFATCHRGSVRVTGVFQCNGKPWTNELVSIYEGNFVFPDTLLSSNRTDLNGNFTVEAHGEDLYPIRPYLYMPNYCNAPQFLDKEWASHFRIRIPDFYVDRDESEPRFTMDFGVIELNGVVSERIGFQKFGDFIKNFAESRWLEKKIERKLKMSEI